MGSPSIGSVKKLTVPRRVTYNQAMEPGPSLSVVVPAYKESARLRGTLEATAAYFDGRRDAYELVIVDDGSPDETAEVARAWAGDRKNVRVLRYEENQGKGHAVRYGVLRAGGERILFMDADLATPIEEIAHLEAALAGGAEIAIGSRPLRESQLLVHQPW